MREQEQDPRSAGRGPGWIVEGGEQSQPSGGHSCGVGKLRGYLSIGFNCRLQVQMRSSTKKEWWVGVGWKCVNN